MAKSLGSPEHRALTRSLVEMRERAGLTQRDLAAALGVARSVVAKVEIGERRLDVVEFIWWCRALTDDAEALAGKIVAAVAKEGRMRTVAQPRRSRR